MEIVNPRSRRVVDALGARFRDVSLTGAQLLTRTLPAALFGGLSHQAFALRLTVTRSRSNESVAGLSATVVWIKEEPGHTAIGIKWRDSVGSEARQKMVEWMRDGA